MAEPDRPGRVRAGGRGTGVATVAGRAVVLGAGLAVLAASGFTYYTYASLSAGLTTSKALAGVQRSAPPHLDNSVNLLLIGLDSRKDMNGNDLPPQFVQDELHAGDSSEVGGYNTNTLIVLHMPADDGKVTALSIPRDDYVQTYGADGGMHKIKEAYGIAKAAAEPKLAAQGLKGAQLEQQSRDAGRAATLATVQNFLGIPIDHFAEINLLGFYDIAQAVGPVTVCLNHATSDPAEDGQGSGFSGQAGLNTLNASQALAFVRQRHNLPGGDLDRTHRQQAFIASVENKLKDEGLFNDLGRMQSLLDVVKKDVVIDDKLDILDFAQQATDLTGGNVEFNTLPITGFATIGGEDVNTVDPALIAREVQQLFGHDPGPAPTASGTPGPTPPPTPAPATTSPAAAPSPSQAPVAASGSSSSDPAAGLPMQGPAVSMGGIPCVN
ncbi:LCP family protein [Kitasatospora viridis]|uniref:LytR family transcriptional attenuator n=1 Tax=Kitasatospora viridis TaxID=281105 RepID=A0A561S9F8_9ACTN|nr:LCP family protein [Kitasatospora viridis]TWF71508.1 LytR family transcriptional attenuator [Kitasatospora viridis]